MAAIPKKRRRRTTAKSLAAKGVADRRADLDRRKGEAMAMMTADPTLSIADTAARTGLSKATISGIRRAMKRELLVPTLELRKLTQKHLQALVDDRLTTALESIDDRAIMVAPVKDRAYTADKLFNMRQLMRGEPTQIMTVDDRRTLNQLVPALIAEAQRRGITFDGDTGKPLPE